MLHQKFIKDFTPHTYSGSFSQQEKSKKNKLGCYKTENIDNLCILSLNVNPKKCLDVFEKDSRKRSSELDFRNFAKHIRTSVNFADTKKKFSEFDNKRFYFSDVLVPLPYIHPVLVEIDKYKQKKTLRWTFGKRKSTCSL